MMQEVQQQFLWCREVMNNRFHQLEELLEVATQQFQIMWQMKAKKRGVRCVNTLDWKSNVRHERNVQQPGVTSDAFHHFELRFPKFEQVGVSEWFHDCEDCEHQGDVFGVGNKTHEWKEVIRDPTTSETYTGEPIYDEEPREGQKGWPEEEFFFAPLRGETPSSPNPLQSEICTNERSKELVEFPHIDSPSQLEDEMNKRFCPYCADFEDPQHVCKHSCSFIMSKDDLTKCLDNQNMVLEYGGNRKVIINYKDEENVKAVPCKITTHSYGLSKKPINFCKMNVIVFDPGGYDSISVSKMIKEMYRQGVKPEHQALISLKFLAIEQEHSGIVIQIVTSRRIQGQNIQEVDDETGVKMLDCISDFRKPSASVFSDAVAYVRRKVHDGVSCVGNLSTDYLVNCLGVTKLFDESTKRKTVLAAENEIGDELNNSVDLMKGEVKKRVT